MRRRGSALLLDHCHRLERLTGPEGRAARERLEIAVGSDLVRVLLAALVGDHGLGPRGLAPDPLC